MNRFLPALKSLPAPERTTALQSGLLLSSWKHLETSLQILVGNKCIQKFVHILQPHCSIESI